MDISHPGSNHSTHIAIAALKNAYEQCSDMAVKESIRTAYKSILHVHHDLGKHTRQDMDIEIDSDFDPSEYCAAV